MGILANAATIFLGGLFGGRLNMRKPDFFYGTLGIGIMLLSMVGFLENMFHVEGSNITGTHLIPVLFAFLAGTFLGQLLHLEERLSGLSKTGSKQLNAFIDTTLFFGVGGLQISGPVALAISGDNSQLLIKALIDAPFALAFGATYGKIASLSSLPVAAIQLLIAVIAHYSTSLFSQELSMQLCAMGFVILFFTGFNLVSPGKFKISNINMLPGIVLVILYGLGKQLLEVIL